MNLPSEADLPMNSFSRLSSSIPTCGWRLPVGAPASALTSCRAQSCRNRSLARDSSPTSCAIRGEHVEHPALHERWRLQASCVTAARMSEPAASVDGV
jgi:hypothetical protein